MSGAVIYALKRWAALETDPDDGWVQMGSNRCEQMMRPEAQDRKS
ncbi:hypothetical protein F9222_24260 [Escherichia coli]|nr:hypothetical protein F9222_24260 [Escherichia coli]